MGWKNVKEHYRIRHIVHVREGKICIGSPYITDIMAVSAEGVLIKKDSDSGRWSVNEDLERYEREMLADPEKLRELATSPDVFSENLKTYTAENNEVIEKLCEERGWPNVTHDGCLMYENTFFESEADCAEYAKSNLRAGKPWIEKIIAEKEQEIAKLREGLENEKKALAALEEKYPDNQ